MVQTHAGTLFFRHFFFFCSLFFWFFGSFGFLFGSPVPHQPAHLYTQDESDAYLRGSSRVLRRRPFIYLKPSKQSQIYRVTPLRTDGVPCREFAGTGPVNFKVVVLGGAGPARRGCLQLPGVSESAGHRPCMPDDEHGHVSGGNAVSGVYRSVVPRDRDHQLSGRANFSSARPPHR